MLEGRRPCGGGGGTKGEEDCATQGFVLLGVEVRVARTPRSTSATNGPWIHPAGPRALDLRPLVIGLWIHPLGHGSTLLGPLGPRTPGSFVLGPRTPESFVLAPRTPGPWIHPGCSAAVLHLHLFCFNSGGIWDAAARETRREDARFTSCGSGCVSTAGTVMQGSRVGSAAEPGGRWRWVE